MYKRIGQQLANDHQGVIDDVIPTPYHEAASNEVSRGPMRSPHGRQMPFLPECTIGNLNRTLTFCDSAPIHAHPFLATGCRKSDLKK